jgi:hypothetical protein
MSEQAAVPVPEVVARYFAAHDRRDTDAALATFASDARVHDDGRDYVGADEIRFWLAKASTEFTYTRTFIDAAELGPGSWLVGNRLEGNFPGGVVELRYRFSLAGDRITELDIAP